MNELSFVLPILNENIENIKKTLITIKEFCKEHEYKFEIFFFDGGSNKTQLLDLLELCKNNKFTYLFLDYPLLKPNKDVAIKNAASICKYENIIITDVDIINIEKKHFQVIISDLLSDNDLVIPNLNRKGGRWNRLFANPFMRVSFPNIYDKIPYPAPGILGIKKKLLAKITKKNFFMDWGGEIQIPVISGIESNKISAPSILKIDSKKRPVKEMVKDAYQVWRTNLYLLNNYGGSVEIKDHLRRFKEENKALTHFSKDFTQRAQDILLNPIESFESVYNEKIENIYILISELEQETGRYEFSVINDLVVLPLAELLFDVKIQSNFNERTEKEIIDLDLSKISLFVDFIFSFFVLKSSKVAKFKNFEYCLNTIPSHYTEHSSIKFYSSYFNNSLELTAFSQKVINDVGEICETENPIKKIKMIENYFDDLIGEVNNKKYMYSDIKFFKNSKIIDQNDLLIKSSILTTIAGYIKSNQITVNGRNNNKLKLDDFLSYVLNNKSFAPIDYQMSYNFSGIEKKNNTDSNEFDCVVLFSGGIDSTAALILAYERGLKPLPLWVGFGQKNESAEEKAVKEISKKLNTNLHTFNIDLSKYISEGWKDWDYIIPARNFIFVTIAGNILSRSNKKKCTILLSAHEEELKDSNTDKSIRFFKTCSEILSKHHNKEIIVTTPFAKSTKSEIISYWDKNWSRKYQITPHDTITCFYGNNCGECKACYKRNLAFLAAGISMDLDLKKSIFKDETQFIRNYFLKEISSFPKKRKEEYQLAFFNNKYQFPVEVTSYINELSLKTIKKIKERREEIQTRNIMESSWI